MRKLNKNIVLIGMPGCGKSTIGQKLASELNMEFCDLDIYIEEREGKTIKDIFEHGEEHFRKIESKAVEEVSKQCGVVISTGGGVIKISKNVELLNKNGIIIFINRPLEHIISDVDVSSRPLLKEGKDKIYNLYKERYDLYKKYCNYQVINDSKLENVIDDIKRIILKPL